MIGKKPAEHQKSIFDVALESFIDMNHELVLLSKQIDWEAVESEFAEYDRDMTKFRKRIGEKGAEKIFKISLMVNASEITEKELKQVMIDSTVQEKNITFPTDAKLYRL